MKAVYILTKDVYKHPAGLPPLFNSSIIGVFNKRESAEAALDELITPYQNDASLKIVYPDPNDKNGFIWFKRNGLLEVAFLIQFHSVLE